VRPDPDTGYSILHRAILGQQPWNWYADNFNILHSSPTRRHTTLGPDWAHAGWLEFQAHSLIGVLPTRLGFCREVQGQSSSPVTGYPPQANGIYI
jgi:hypothetical protein